MELTWAQQSAAFCYSILLGAALGVLYGALKFWRVSFSLGKASVFALDVAFMLMWALAVFYFSLAFLLGYIRLYVFAGSLLGFALQRLTLGRLLARVYCPAVRFIRGVLQKFCVKSKIFAKYLLKIACKLLYNIGSGFKWLKRKKSKIQSFSEIRNCNDKKRFTKKQSAQKKQPKRADIRNTDKSSRQNCGSRRKGRRPQGH